MKIITWNCNMAFRKKSGLILAYNPDILIVPECEHPDKIQFAEPASIPTDLLWFGSNKNKGLGIFAFNNFRIKKARGYNPNLKLIIPIVVSRNELTFTLYAIWANNPDDPDGQYVEQVWKAIHHYDKKIRPRQTVLAGDFNSNTIWDKKYREGNHTNVVKRLEEKGIYSCYHLQYQQVQGKEEDPTFYLYKHKNKPYHLDYCFASRDITDKICSVEIGDYNDWKPYSDHVPVIVTFNSN